MSSVSQGKALEPRQDTAIGELMECLVRDRAQFVSEEAFRAHAIEAVRRFIGDLRGLEIEISLRPNHGDRQRTLG